MKKILAMVFALAVLSVPVVGSCQGKAIQRDCDCISCDFAGKVERYDAIISEVVDARTDFDSYMIYDASELTPEILDDRVDTNTVVIERCIGVVTDKETGAGMILNQSGGYYISYRNTPNIQKGSIVVSYMVYNPNNNFVDDIIERYDFVIALDKPSQGNSDEARVIVDRIEGDYAVVEFSKDDTIKMLDILAEDINGKVSEGMEIPVVGIEGKFYGDTICTDSNGIEDTYYQFRSDDDSVWWILTAEEIGHIPNTEDKYTLYYTDNGTVKETPVCDCLPEWECECYLYDDIFFAVEVANSEE